MDKICCTRGCKSQAILNCACDSSFQSCSAHIVEHLILPGAHKVESFVVKLDEDIKNEVVESYNNKLIYLEELARLHTDLTNKTALLIITESYKIKNKILAERQRIKNLLSFCLSTNLIYKEEVENFENHLIKDYDLKEYECSLREKLNEIYEFWISNQDTILNAGSFGTELQVTDRKSIQFIGNKLDLHINQINIKVKNEYSGEMSLNFYPFERTENLKLMISNILNISVKSQILLYKSQKLKNSKTLADYHIEDNSVINLLIKIQIFVKIPYENKIITLNVLITETIENLKKAIEKKTEIPLKKQRLTFLNKYLENNKKLGDYNITEDKTLVLFYYGIREKGNPDNADVSK